jgi:hypothetical protein
LRNVLPRSVTGEKRRLTSYRNTHPAARIPAQRFRLQPRL